MSRISTLVLCMTWCCLAPARAATITVTSDSDGTGGPDCTLRDAITAANTDTATGGCVAGSGADTIELPVDATILLVNALSSITSEVIINGNGSTVERDRADDTPHFRIFTVALDGGLTLNNLTVSNGSLLDSHEAGGGILNFGSLTLIHSTVSGNDGGGYGGGIANAGVLTMTDSTLSNNEVSSFGGGIFNGNDAEATVTNSTFIGNVDNFHGGGIASGGTFTLINSTISGNVDNGNGGGGIWIGNGELTLTYSTVCGNLQDQIVGNYTDGGGNLVAEECPPCTSGDLDGDGVVGPMDLAILLGSWGPCPGCPADVDDDGQVDAFDLATLLSVWGPCR